MFVKYFFFSLHKYDENVIKTKKWPNIWLWVKCHVIFDCCVSFFLLRCKFSLFDDDESITEHIFMYIYNEWQMMETKKKTTRKRGHAKIKICCYKYMNSINHTNNLHANKILFRCYENNKLCICCNLDHIDMDCRTYSCIRQN